MRVGEPKRGKETFVFLSEVVRHFVSDLFPGHIEEGAWAFRITRNSHLYFDEEEVENLLQVVTLKGRCKEAGVEQVDAGPKGAVVGFRNDDFTNPVGLVEFFSQQAGTVKLRPDHKLVYMRQWNTPEDRLDGVRYLVGELAKIAIA